MPPRPSRFRREETLHSFSWRSPSPPTLLIFNCGRAARQNVAKIKPNRALMRVLWRAGRHCPGIAEEVRILHHLLKRAVPAVPPNRMRPARRNFLDAPVLAVRRSRISIADIRRLVRIEGRVPANVDAAVIDIRCELSKRHFEARHGRSRMHEGRTAVRADDEVRRSAE